jgi:hypothetical protein
MLEDLFDSLGPLKANLILTLLLMLECSKSAATKSVDVALILLPMLTVEILDPLMVALDLAHSLSLFLLTLPMVHGLSNGPGSEELLLSEITTPALITPSLVDLQQP